MNYTHPNTTLVWNDDDWYPHDDLSLGQLKLNFEEDVNAENAHKKINQIHNIHQTNNRVI